MTMLLPITTAKQTMTTTNNKKIYTKLSYYFEKQIPVYFRLANQFNQKGEPIYRVGLIKDLSQEKETFVLIENVLGELPFLFEDIDYESINIARVRK